MKNHLEQIKKYDANPDEDAVKRLENRLSLTLQKRDAAEVAVSDQKELQRVENGPKKSSVQMSNRVNVQ
ncbi:Protein of unknown function (DUF2853) [Bartonella apihabitans]|uniref:Uncharacterized protein n=1 Tax=Bartonella apihabitans TaxID=2750929 RepID=A0A1U9MCB8_9HYPH|nr:Protein of unknown function (DUF2853) [Bartonella apihabitans]